MRGLLCEMNILETKEWKEIETALEEYRKVHAVDLFGVAARVSDYFAGQARVGAEEAAQLVRDGERVLDAFRDAYGRARERYEYAKERSREYYGKMVTAYQRGGEITAEKRREREKRIERLREKVYRIRPIRTGVGSDRIMGGKSKSLPVYGGMDVVDIATVALLDGFRFERSGDSVRAEAKSSVAKKSGFEFGSTTSGMGWVGFWIRLSSTEQKRAEEEYKLLVVDVVEEPPDVSVLKKGWDDVMDRWEGFSRTYERVRDGVQSIASMLGDIGGKSDEKGAVSAPVKAPVKAPVASRDALLKLKGRWG